MLYLLKSLLIFLVLYSLAIGVAAATYFNDPSVLPWVTGISLVTVVFQYLAGPWLIRLLLDIDWRASLPARNHEFLVTLCKREGIRLPRIGIIHGPMPNAFTFGRLQSDASIVLTSGMLDALTPEEANAVIAHEVGHIKHWDFLTMTLASIVPLLLYHAYAIARRIRDNHFITWSVYGAYWVSQFIVLYLSRTREYWADQFSAQATGDATWLSSGLVKICYGLAKLERETAWSAAHGDDQQKAYARNTALMAGKIGVMGVSNAQAAFIVGGPGPEGAGAVMRWDLVNPWARVYELWATHPLTARRVKALNHEASLQGKEAVYKLPENTRIQWSGFPVELCLWIAPFAFAIALIAANSGLMESKPIGLLCIALGASWLARIAFRYRGNFASATIRELAEDTEPSQMRPRAVRLEGEIVGRGQPEAFWSPDLVIKDETGFIFINDRQSMPFARLLMASKADKWAGRRVVVEGWYRRGLMPYVELAQITASDNSDSHSSYSRWLQAIFAVAVSIGAYWFLAGR